MDLVKRHQSELNTSFGYVNSVATFLLLGERRDAAMIQAVDLPSFADRELQKWVRLTADFVAGNLSEEEFLENAGGKRWRLCYAQHLIGLMRLSQGDRQGAYEHFAKSVATGAYFYVLYPYSRTYLIRLKQDPAWPPWIPVKE